MLNCAIGLASLPPLSDKWGRQRFKPGRIVVGGGGSVGVGGGATVVVTGGKITLVRNVCVFFSPLVPSKREKNILVLLR